MREHVCHPSHAFRIDGFRTFDMEDTGDTAHDRYLVQSGHSVSQFVDIADRFDKSIHCRPGALLSRLFGRYQYRDRLLITAGQPRLHRCKFDCSGGPAGNAANTIETQHLTPVLMPRTYPFAAADLLMGAF